MSSADETFQISDERFEKQPDQRETFDTGDREPTPVQGPSGCRGFAMGCGCAILGLLVVLVAVGAWVAMSWKGWAAGFAKQAAAEAVARIVAVPGRQSSRGETHQFAGRRLSGWPAHHRASQASV